MQKLIAAICLAAAALSPACGSDKPPNSLFDAAGYHVRGDAVYYLNAFPGKPFEIDAADADTFQAVDSTYAHDSSAVYFDGREVPGADPATFELLDRPGFFKDHRHVYQLDRSISDDPAHFEFLDGDLMKDSAAVYWSDGRCYPRTRCTSRSSRTPITICSPGTAGPSTSTATRFPTPILQPSAQCGARMRVTTGMSTTSLT